MKYCRKSFKVFNEHFKRWWTESENERKENSCRVSWTEKLRAELMTPSQFPSGPEEGWWYCQSSDKSDFSWLHSKRIWNFSFPYFQIDERNLFRPPAIVDYVADFFVILECRVKGRSRRWKPLANHLRGGQSIYKIFLLFALNQDPMMAACSSLLYNQVLWGCCMTFVIFNN